MLGGIANSVDPDQILLKEQSDLGLHMQFFFFFQKKNDVQNFRTITAFDMAHKISFSF